MNSPNALNCGMSPSCSVPCSLQMPPVLAVVCENAKHSPRRSHAAAQRGSVSMATPCTTGVQGLLAHELVVRRVRLDAGWVPLEATTPARTACMAKWAVSVASPPPMHKSLPTREYACTAQAGLPRHRLPRHRRPPMEEPIARILEYPLWYQCGSPYLAYSNWPSPAGSVPSTRLLTRERSRRCACGCASARGEGHGGGGGETIFRLGESQSCAQQHEHIGAPFRGRPIEHRNRQQRGRSCKREDTRRNVQA